MPSAPGPPPRPGSAGAERFSEPAQAVADLQHRVPRGVWKDRVTGLALRVPAKGRRYARVIGAAPGPARARRSLAACRYDQGGRRHCDSRIVSQSSARFADRAGGPPPAALAPLYVTRPGDRLSNSYSFRGYGCPVAATGQRAQRASGHRRGGRRGTTRVSRRRQGHRVCRHSLRSRSEASSRTMVTGLRTRRAPTGARNEWCRRPRDGRLYRA